MSEFGPLKIRLVFTFPNERAAERIHAAVRIDDDKFVRTSISGSAISAEAEAPDALSLKRTVDDYLACVTAAEGAASDAPDPDDEGKEN